VPAVCRRFPLTLFPTVTCALLLKRFDTTVTTRAVFLFTLLAAFFRPAAIGLDHDENSRRNCTVTFQMTQGTAVYANATLSP